MKEAQKDKILRWLFDSRTISPKEAMDKWNCWRLAARIYDLREYGWNIKMDMVGKTGKKHAEYRLVQTAGEYLL
jgi:hypothetical protein